MSESAGSVVTVPIEQIEVRHLAELVDQFLQLLRDTEIGQDAALDLLTPDVYPDDAVASAEFADATRADLLHRRVADARAVRACLSALAESTDSSPDELRLRPADVDPWLRTLAALRLVIASRLGIDVDGAHDPEDPRFGGFDWLGYRLDLLVEAADDLDEERSPTP